jgi:hypothetical protein
MTIDVRTITVTLSPYDVIQWAKKRLAVAQREFAKNPNSTNWNVALRAMFVWQQVEHTFLRGGVRSAYSLCSDLGELPYGEWDDVISLATVGTTVGQALQDFATI